ncbi:hypothetical protein [Haloarchaeobius litoreus]|uniref:Big-1 domain-containing protein n=1 Tax=Haloarchaeobius litoreus TaxID=755306 RepID=A0ABD6DNH9_9EURY|nr:hypothetical protein [Haloarchaeobius litoreus]
MGFLDDERGVSVQVGAVILLAFVVIAISAYQVQVVPSQNEEVEYNHNQRLQSQLQELEGTIGSMSATGDGRTVTVDLATTYPARTLFVNPPRPTGRLETVGTTQPRVSFEVRNATAANPDVDDFWDGTTRNYSTGAIAYRPNYNVYQAPPTTVVANSLVYNEYSSTTLVANQQSIFDGDSISLVALRGSLRREGGTASVNVRPVSASTTTVPVSATGSDNVTISLVSRLSPDTWRELIDETGEYSNQSGHVTAVVDNGTTTMPNGEQLYRVEFELERGQTYRLQLSRVGVGELSATEQSTNASYAVAMAETVTTEEDVNATVTVEVRDQYNNPKSGVEVNATVVGSAGGSIVDTPRTTNEDGRATFTYNTSREISGTSSKSDTVQVSFSGDPSGGFDANAPENVSTTVTVRNTDGSGTGTGVGGGGGAYSIDWQDPISSNPSPGVSTSTCSETDCTWDVGVDGDGSLDLTAVTSPNDIDGLEVEYVLNNSTVASIPPSERTDSTGPNGETGTTLTANANGTVAVYVASNGDSDVINVTVSNVSGGGGGGGNGPPIVTSASITNAPINYSDANTAQTVTVTFNESMDTSVAPTVEIQGMARSYTVSGSYANPTTWTGTANFQQDSEETTATIRVADAEDQSGNTMAPDTSNTFQVDTARPQQPSSTDFQTAPISASNASNVAVDVEFGNQPESGTVYVRITGPDGNTVVGTAPADTGSTTTTVTGIDISSLSDGTVTAESRIVDDVGNINQGGYRQARDALKDTKEPLIQTFTVSDETTDWYNPEFSVTNIVSDMTLSDVTIELVNYNGQVVDTETGAANSTVTLNDNTFNCYQCTYTIRLTATDQVGQTNSSNVTDEADGSGGGSGGGSPSADIVQRQSGSGSTFDGGTGAEFVLENTGSKDVTITDVEISVSGGSASQIREQNGGSGRTSSEVYIDAATVGYYEDSSGGGNGLSLDTRQALTTNAIIAAGDTATMSFYQFRNNGGQSVDISGRTLTVTVYFSDGSSESYTFTA